MAGSFSSGSYGTSNYSGRESSSYGGSVDHGGEGFVPGVTDGNGGSVRAGVAPQYFDPTVQKKVLEEAKVVAARRAKMSAAEVLSRGGNTEALVKGELADLAPGVRSTYVGYTAPGHPSQYQRYEQTITDVDPGRAAADIASIAIGIPGLGALYDAAADPYELQTDEDRIREQSARAKGTYGQTSRTPPPTGGAGDGEHIYPIQVASAAAPAPAATPTATPVSPLISRRAGSISRGRGLRPSFAEGGFIDSMIATATDQSLDAPSPGVMQQGLPGNPVMAPSYEEGGMVTRRKSYADGGMVAGVNPAGNSSPVPMQQMDQEATRIMQQHPEQMMQVKQAIAEAVQTGELTPQELNMAVQLASAAAQNPQLYPQIRQFAIQQGLADEQDIPPEYDQGLVFALLMASKAAQSVMPQSNGQPPQALAGGAPQSNGQAPQASMATGGNVPDSRNSDASVAINAHEGEVVVHAGAVRALGTEHFAKKYNDEFELDGTRKQKPNAGSASA